MSITMSSLHRLLNCPGSAALPKAETHNEWADAGIAEHEELSDLDAASVDLNLRLPPNAKSEAKVAYDVSTGVGRLIESAGLREYGVLGEFEIAGSADVMGFDDERVYILDYKTGYGTIPPASKNPQLWGYGLAFARALGKESAVMSLVWTRTGAVDTYEASSIELAAFAEELERLLTSVARERAQPQPTTVEGAWCKHCASKPYCPSKNALLAQVANNGLASIGQSAVTSETVAAAYRQLVSIEHLVTEARGRLVKYITENGPIEVGDGRMFGRYVRKGNRRIDPDIAELAIADAIGDPAAAGAFVRDAFKRTISQAAISRAAASSDNPKELIKQIMRSIEDRGGIARSDTIPIGEFDPDKNEPVYGPSEDAIEEAERLLKGVDWCRK